MVIKDDEERKAKLNEIGIRWRKENRQRDQIRKRRASMQRTSEIRCGYKLAQLRSAKMNGVCDICGAKMKWNNNREWTQHAVMLDNGCICKGCNQHLEYFNHNPDVLMRIAYYLRLANDIASPVIRKYPYTPELTPVLMRYFHTGDYYRFVRKYQITPYDIPTAAERRKREKEEAEKQGAVSEVQTQPHGLDKEKSRTCELTKQARVPKKKMGRSSTSNGARPEVLEESRNMPHMRR